MSQQLTNLDELTLGLVENQAKQYMVEALTAYRAGAPRAAIMLTWVSVCVDIIDKIRDLSISGDACAKELAEKLDGILPSDYTAMQVVERDILAYACDRLELISPVEKAQLARLKEDRNLCAHPTFSQDGNQFIPTPELARAYIIQAATCLLSRPPTRGKLIVDDIFKLITSDSFPVDTDRAYAVLSSDRHLGKVRSSSVRSVIILLLKRVFKDSDKILRPTFDRIVSALGAIERLFPDIYYHTMLEKLSQMLSESDDVLLKRAIPFLGRRSELQGKIEVAVTLRLEESISRMKATEVIRYEVGRLADLRPSMEKALFAAMGKDDFGPLHEVLEALPCRVLRSRAIDYFVSSTSFASSHSRGVNVLLPHAQFFDSDDLTALFEGVVANSNWGINQILKANGTDEVLEQLYMKTKKSVLGHGKLWIEFRNKITEDYDRFPLLDAVLLEDGLLDSLPEKSTEDESGESIDK